jgi:hypothetical protein
MPIYTVSNPRAAVLQNPGQVEQGAALDQPVLPQLGFVLDQSGSMESLVNEAVDSFNALVSEQQKLQASTGGTDSSFSLALFNDTVRLLYDAVPIAKVPPLTREFYAPAGGTALNDAIGQMIQAIGKRARRSSRVLIAILTDGNENTSHRFSESDIFQMITYRRTTYDWQFIFIGPPGSEAYALSIGIPKSNVVSFSTDATGIKTVMARLSKGMKAYQLGDRRYMLKLRN